MLLPVNYNQNSTTFGVNLKSPKLKLSRQDFFIKIRGYGRNKNWADEVIKTTDTAVNLLRKNVSAENVLKIITAGIAQANKQELNLVKRNFTGILRTQRDGWRGKTERNELMTPYSIGRYSIYAERLDKTSEKPLFVENEKIGISLPQKKNHYILHGEDYLINNSLNYIFNICKNFFPKYLGKDIKPENLEDINSTIAEIRWVLAHSTPWLRGSDAISNAFMRAIYKALGIKAYPPAKGISFDLEAYCTNLKDYKKNFTSYFERTPEIAE